MLVGAYLDKDRQTKVHLFGIQQGNPFANNPLCLKCLDASPAGVPRQSNALPQGFKAFVRILLQIMQYSAVSLINVAHHANIVRNFPNIKIESPIIGNNVMLQCGIATGKPNLE